ncbi:MAG: hypothetical protein LBS60_14660 [Deltaproteobacteria bacterium]|jgi:hypothetical protein|nr:hypothetical protein [Deltaproteobacteria bacterium]
MENTDNNTTDLASLSADIKNISPKIDSVKSELIAEMKTLGARIDSVDKSVNSLRSELKPEIKTDPGTMSNSFGTIFDSLNKNFDLLNNKLVSLKYELLNEINKANRIHNITVLILVALLSFAITKIFSR